ncbi:MAG: hypothetical protein U0838_02500 [Chloroflexota bacterium]
MTAGDLARPSADVRRSSLRIANEAGVQHRSGTRGARQIAISVDLDTAAETARLVVEEQRLRVRHGGRSAWARPREHGLPRGLLGGSLDVYSRPGGGTTVRASVPMSGRLASGDGS